jgi:hypothetical protein
MAVFGHGATQASQAVQSSLIIRAIWNSFDSVNRDWARAGFQAHLLV